ncbi:hypothetical protein NO222_03700 [Gluconacetobacter entanii]|nr:hypothetical protein [Gluconacetobacter entanii]
MLGGIGTLGFVGNASGRGFTTDDLLHVLASDRRISPAQVHGAYEAAYDATKSAPGTRLNTNLEALIDLTNVTGSLSEAQVALPAFAKMSARLQALDREHGGSGDQAYAAAKAMDIMGGMIDEQIDPVTGHVTRSINPALMQSRLDKMTRVAVATNDKVSPNDYLNFAKQARTAGMTLTDDYIYERLPAMLQTIGGDRVGTAMMSMSQLFQGGKLSGKSYDALAEIGLAAQDHVTRERDPLTGRMRTVHHRAGVYDLDVMRHDPLAWVEKAQDRMEKAGIHGTENQVTALMKASQRSTVAGVLGDLLKDMPAILRDQERIRNTDISKIDSSAASHLNQMTASWDRFMTVTGNANTSNAVALMDKVTGGLNALSDFEHRHPNMARDLTLVGGGLGALGVGLGAAFLAISPFLALKGLAGRAAGAAGAEGAAGAAEGASASILSRMGSVGGGLGRILAPIGLAYQAYQIHQTVRDDEAKMWEDARKNPREMRQAQWAYDHTFGIVGHNFRDTQSPQVSAPPQAPIQVTAQVLLDKRVLAEAMTEYSVQQARQGTRASGTAPDTVQHVQLPGRALGR